MRKRDGQRPRHGLFARIYLHGLLLLIALVVVGVAIFHFFGDPHGWHDAGRRMAVSIGRNLDNGPEGVGRIAFQLELVAEALNRGVTVFDAKGELLASAGPAAPSRLPAEATATGRQPTCVHDDGRALFVFALRSPKGAEGFLVLDLPGGSPSVRLLTMLLIVFAVLGVTSWPVARAISRPVEKLTATARRIADGDLSARTGLKRNDEVGVLAVAMDEMARRLEQRLRADKELLASISHELRTPLTRMRVALELCEDGLCSDTELKAALAGLAGDVAELERLVTDVLTVARFALASDVGGTSGFVPRRQEIHIADFLTEIADRFRAAHGDRTLSVTLPPTTCLIDADPALARRLLENLLDNAFKYADTHAPIELIGREEADGLTLEVRDRGPALSKEDLERLFEPFFRGERSRSRAAGGVGLGLPLCRAIALAHGGSVEAERREGGGLCVRVRFPWRASPQESPRQNPENTSLV